MRTVIALVALVLGLVTFSASAQKGDDQGDTITQPTGTFLGSTVTRPGFQMSYDGGQYKDSTRLYCMLILADSKFWVTRANDSFQEMLDQKTGKMGWYYDFYVNGLIAPRETSQEWRSQNYTMSMNGVEMSEWLSTYSNPWYGLDGEIVEWMTGISGGLAFTPRENYAVLSDGSFHWNENPEYRWDETTMSQVLTGRTEFFASWNIRGSFEPLPAVPEPASLALLTAGGLCMFYRRKPLN